MGFLWPWSGVGCLKYFWSHLVPEGRLQSPGPKWQVQPMRWCPSTSAERREDRFWRMRWCLSGIWRWSRRGCLELQKELRKKRGCLLAEIRLGSSYEHGRGDESKSTKYHFRCSLPIHRNQGYLSSRRLISSQCRYPLSGQIKKYYHRHWSFQRNFLDCENILCIFPSNFRRWPKSQYSPHRAN